MSNIDKYSKLVFTLNNVAKLTLNPQLMNIVRKYSNLFNPTSNHI